MLYVQALRECVLTWGELLRLRLSHQLIGDVGRHFLVVVEPERGRRASLGHRAQVGGVAEEEVAEPLQVLAT